MAALLVFVLGAVYTAAGQDNAESNPRYVTISVVASRLVVGGQSGAYSISTNAARRWIQLDGCHVIGRSIGQFTVYRIGFVDRVSLEGDGVRVQAGLRVGDCQALLYRRGFRHHSVD